MTESNGPHDQISKAGPPTDGSQYKYKYQCHLSSISQPLKVPMKSLLALTLAASLVGCASVPHGDAQQDAALKNFSAPAPTQAGLYIYRNEFMGALVTMDVKIDDQDVGQTGRKTYLFKEVTPGKHTITSIAENTDALEVEVKPGTLNYVWQEVKMGFLSARTKLHLVDEAEGQKGVRESTLAPTK